MRFYLRFSQGSALVTARGKFYELHAAVALAFTPAARGVRGAQNSVGVVEAW